MIHQNDGSRVIHCPGAADMVVLVESILLRARLADARELVSEIDG